MYPDVNLLIRNITWYSVTPWTNIKPDRERSWKLLFLTNNFQGLKKVLEDLSNQKSPSQTILKCKILFDFNTVENDLIFIKTDFLAPVTTIKSLEKSNVSLVDSIKLIENTIV